MQHNTTAINTPERAITLFARVMGSAPTGLLLCAALGLALVGVFQFKYYEAALPDFLGEWLIILLSFGISIFVESLGFFLLVATVRDYSSGARKEGTLGLLATILLYAFSMWEAYTVSVRFAENDHPRFLSLFSLIGTIVTIVRVVEFRIALTVTATETQRKKNDLLSEENAALKMEILELRGAVSRFEQEKKARETAEVAENERIAKESERIQREDQERKQKERDAELSRLRKIAAGISQDKSPDRRGKILAKAREILHKEGRIPTKREIETALGFSQGSVKYYFPNGSYEAAIKGEEISALNTELSSI